MVYIMAYKILRKKIRFTTLDFLSTNDVVFVENGYKPALNRCIIKNLGNIKKMFYEYELNFYYMPYLDKDMDEVIAYRAPYLQPGTVNNKRWASDAFLDYLAKPELRHKLPPFLITQYADNIAYAYFFSPGSESGVMPCFEALRNEIYSDIWEDMASPSIYEEPDGGRLTADESFSDDIEKLMDDVKRKIEYLRYSGVSQWALEQLVKPEIKLSRLVATDGYRIILPDYNNMEIVMQPLVKAVYLLFLRHEEGILFKHLPDYRDELYQIYNKVRVCSAPPVGMTDEKIRNSIKLVTDPLSNSINEKCARIREAFISRFDDSMAVYYYVTGRRGEPKRITLPRNMIELK